MKQVQKHLSDQMFKLKNQPIAVEGEDTNVANKEDKAEMKGKILCLAALEHL